MSEQIPDSWRSLQPIQPRKKTPPDRPPTANKKNEDISRSASHSLRIRSTADQIKYFTQYMAAHPNFAKHAFSSSGKNVDLEWFRVKQLLSNYGPDRSIKQWKSCWKDLKRRAKGELANIRKALQSNADIIPTLSYRARVILQTTGLNGDDNTQSEDMEDAADGDIIIIEEASTEATDKENTSEDQDEEKAVEQNTTRQLRDFRVKSKDQETSTEEIHSRKRLSATEEPTINSKEPKTCSTTEELLNMLNKFIDYEKETSKDAHEREMIRMDQNNKVLNLVNRVLNVFEKFGPGLQNNFGQNSHHNEGLVG